MPNKIKNIHIANINLLAQYAYICCAVLDLGYQYLIKGRKIAIFCLFFSCFRAYSPEISANQPQICLFCAANKSAYKPIRLSYFKPPFYHAELKKTTLKIEIKKMDTHGYYLTNCYSCLCLIAVLLLCSQVILGKNGAVDTLKQGFFMDENVNSVIIPVKIINNLVLLPIRINNSLPLDFILDTGVSNTILTEPAWGSILGLHYTDKLNLRGLGSGLLIQADVASNVQFSLPQIKAYKMNLVVLPHDVLSFSGMFGQSVFGIIGYDLFRNFVIEINYSEKYIRLSRPNTYKTRPKMTAIPLNIYKGKPHIDATIFDTDNKPQKVKLLLDTGASQALSLISSADISVAPKHIVSYIGKGLSGDIMGAIAYINALQIAHFQLDKPIVCYPDSVAMSLQIGSVPWQGSIGSDLLQRFKVVIDYQHNKLYLKKNNRYKQAFSYNISGIDLLAVGEQHKHFVVDYVRKGSCADKAGICANDEILAINGNILQNLSMNEVLSLLNKKPNSQLKLRIKRNETILHYKLHLQNEL